MLFALAALAMPRAYHTRVPSPCVRTVGAPGYNSRRVRSITSAAIDSGGVEEQDASAFRRIARSRWANTRAYFNASRDVPSDVMMDLLRTTQA